MNSNRVNYGDVAHKYDSNPTRHRIQVDGTLINYLYNAITLPIKALDIACGTGIYLDYQQNALTKGKVDWFGLDRSKEMVGRAESKVTNVSFHIGNAENLPYNSSDIDYVHCSYAFHHFYDKRRALEEIYRVLKPRGMCKITTISPEFLGDWHIYKFFPETKKIDESRCWPAGKIVSYLEQLGFSVELHLEQIRRNRPAADLYASAKNRDVSELILLEDKYYASGLERLHQLAEKNEIFSNSFTKVIAIGQKLAE